jgi:4-hydroxybenzoate polyprenyltransferase
MFFEFLKLIRVHQWVKNFFVFVPLLFSMHLFDWSYLKISLLAFLIFSLASSSIYVINDLVDVNSDRAHPTKKNRPIASGKIKVPFAVTTSALLIILVFVLIPYSNINFLFSVVGFIVLNILYSFIFKNIVILDVFSIAAGFAIRVLGGAFAINVPISNWLLLTTMFISLFLGVMKRHSELVLVSEKENNLESRKVLSQYSLNFADQMATVAAAGVIICYALYTVAPRTVNVFGSENLIYTTPFVVFGIFRFMYLEYQSQKGENTTKVVATDIPMIVTVILYILVTMFIIYKGV